MALLEAISGKNNVKDTKMLLDKTEKENDGVEAFREAIGRKDRVPSIYSPQDMTKDYMDGVDIEMFPNEVHEGKDSGPPDIKLDTFCRNSDTLGKGRISLLKRSP